MCSSSGSANFSDLFWENHSFPVALPADVPTTSEESMYHQVAYACSTFVLPIIFAFGILGNALNILIFTRRKFRHSLDDIEKSATTGLVALAISDLLFCLFGFPESFLRYGIEGRSDDTLEVMALYYKGYKQTLMNIFLFSSTWLIVVISIERYVAVVYPLKARWMVRVKRTVLIDVTVYLVSVLINIPGFLKYEVMTLRGDCPGDPMTYLLVMTSLYAENPSIKYTYRILWTVFGTFLPLAILALCNIRLLVEVYKSRRRYSADQRKYSTSKITFILIAVILLYVILVCPSMLLSFFSNLVTSGPIQGVASYFRFRTAITLTNVAQALNFAMNFLLYCVISKPFRENLRSQVYACVGRKNNSLNNSLATSQRYYVVEGNTK